MIDVPGTECIKRTEAGGYHVQMWRDNVSYSRITTKLETAIRLRDEMRAKLGVPANALGEAKYEEKIGTIPGTTEQLPCGIILSYRHLSDKRPPQYLYTVSYHKEVKSDVKVRGIYICTDSTVSTLKFINAYNRALLFRTVYELHSHSDELELFIPSSFNKRVMSDDRTNEILRMVDKTPLIYDGENAKWLRNEIKMAHANLGRDKNE